MAYATGSASNVTDLLTALQNACVANGWTLSGNVLWKGTCYISAVISSSSILLTGGTGKDGSNNLTGAGPSTRMGGVIWTGDTCTYPVDYYIHINTSPDEVMMFINYEAVRWQFLGFGQSPSPGLPGTGNWVSATGTGGQKIYLTSVGGGASNSSLTSAGLFWCNASNSGYQSYIHHGLDGQGWSGAVGNNEASSTTAANGVWSARALNDVLPNTWNGQAVLLPVDLVWRRASSKISLVGQIKHCRYVRNDNYDDGDIIDLSPDKWKVYPVHKKNTATRNGGNGIDHSGTMALAVRYDGP